MLRILISALVVFTTFAHADSNREIERLKNAVVKIHASSAAPDYFTPWRLLNSGQSSGSGAVIKGNKILTNAHVVANARYLQAQKNGDPKKYLARTIFVSHASDLAILTVDDPDFFTDLKPLPFGKLPDPLQEVSVYGYPFGGNSLSITKGILSRVEHQFYAHGGSYLLAGQIDAAINPGNSGGPVIANQKIVGVVMQANSGGRAENLGYFVPPSVIQHVMKDAEDNVNDGFADLGFRTQSLESPAMKSAYTLKSGQSGVLITKVFSDSPANGILEANDIILRIDGFDIADDRSIEFRKNMRTNFKYAIDQYHVGDEVKITVSRHGEIMELVVPADNKARSYSLVQNERFDQLPSYFIYGGIVFVPLNMNLIKRWGRDWHNKAPVSFLHSRNRWSSEEQQELVVALKILPADVNLGYHDWKNWIIDTVNGEPIRDFRQFYNTVKNNERKHVVLKDGFGYQLVIDHKKALSTEEEILSLYQIPASRSPDLEALQD
jgi:S1-C subfamily serine protease